jgi:hypothetical protein
VKNLLDFFNELGERGRRKGEEEGEKRDSPQELSFSIEGSLVIQGSRMPKTEEDDEDEQEKPSGIVENGDKGHHRNGDEEDGFTPFPKESIGNMASVKLPDRKKIEGRDEKTHPSGITDGVKKDIMILRNRTDDQPLNEREKDRVSQPESPFLDLRRRNDLRKL